MARQPRVALVAFSVSTRQARIRMERCLRRQGFVALLPTVMWRQAGHTELQRLRRTLPVALRTSLRQFPYVAVLLHVFAVDTHETLWMAHAGTAQE
jgi:hypothetical protein